MTITIKIHTFVLAIINQSSPYSRTLMKLILIIILLIIWLVSFIKFKSKMKYFKTATHILERRNNESGGVDTDLLLRLSSAYIMSQKYRDAYNCLNKAMNSGGLSKDEMSKVIVNINFCEKPIFSYTAGGRNRNTYFHYFLLNRIGRKRFNFLIKEDFDETDFYFRTKGA